MLLIVPLPVMYINKKNSETWPDASGSQRRLLHLWAGIQWLIYMEVGLTQSLLITTTVNRSWVVHGCWGQWCPRKHHNSNVTCQDIPGPPSLLSACVEGGAWEQG